MVGKLVEFPVGEPAMAHVKTAVSLPEDLYRRLDEIAARRCMSRSKVLAEALAEYVAHADGEELSRQLEAAYGNPTPEEVAEDEALLRASRREMRRIIEETGDTWDGPAG